MSDGHQIAREQLLEIEEASEGTIELLSYTLDDSGRFAIFEIALPFQGIDRVQLGLLIRARERFLVWVPRGFPFVRPSIHAPHRRFAGFAHVQWGCSICLYQSSSDWKPEDGMYGLITRLDGWIRDAALDRLDPDAAPLHPPVAYSSSSARLVVPVSDTPAVSDDPWIGYAVLADRGKRTEIVGWVGIEDERPNSFAVAVLLPKQLPFEYPTNVDGLVTELERQGLERWGFIGQIAALGLHTEVGKPLLVAIGTPMRRVEAGGPRLQHLDVWEIEASDADQLRVLNAIALDDPSFKAMGEEAFDKVDAWSREATVNWCNVREQRPAVTRRRDGGAPATWFRDKTIEIWGCGAVGTKVAESIARAGVSRLILVDNGTVVPGILVRQSFEDADIGEAKARALAARVHRIDPNIDVQPEVRDQLQRLDEDDPLSQDAHLVVDCTGSAALRLKLENVFGGLEGRPPIASMGVSHDASCGIATVSMPGHSGGPFDLTRRLKLEACRKPELSSLLETFWPREPRGERFQPEPGCSEPTFVGSDVDLASLSARMLNAVAHRLSEGVDRACGTGWLFHTDGPLHSYSWSRDFTLGEEGRGYSVRVSPEAMREMRAWARRSRRLVGPACETGGLIFGEINEAAGVLWVTEVEGPPPDSDASEEHFTCGVEGMVEASREKQERFRDSVSCLGSWHTHPRSPAEPSDVDMRAVAQLLAAPGSTRRTCLLLILSGNPDAPTLGAHAFRTHLRAGSPLHFAPNAAATARVEPASEIARDVGLALSGGGSRAIAFHLGCFRALEDLGLLSRLQVISSVSGGSVLAAMYAYSAESFRDFDDRVVDLLRRGLMSRIARKSFSPNAIAKTLLTIVTTGCVSLLRTVLGPLPQSLKPALLDPAKPPPRRIYSRTEAFRAALASSLFGEALVRDVARESLDIVINATELRTGSAFRFGSRESGCWRFGSIPADQATVADAVAASAAYPVALPALDREYEFLRRGETSPMTRVLLTDGGVFENLGVSPMEPGRAASLSTNVFNPHYIISCDAGAGLLDDDAFPMWWSTRMKRSFLTTFRKVQDGTRKRLHQLAAAGEIGGFVLSYLGQNETALPWVPPALPSRSDVYLYPTDFSAMPEKDIERLSLRGELLTRLLLSHYLPHL